MRLALQIRRMGGLAAAALGLATIPVPRAEAQPPVAGWAVRLGQQIGTLGTATSAGPGVVNSAGQWAVRTRTSQTNPVTDQALMRETGLYQSEGQAIAAIPGATLDGWGPFDLDDAGNLIQILFLSGAVTLNDDTGIFRNGMPVLREGDACTAPQVGPGTVVRGFTNVKVNAAGDRIVFTGALDDPAVAGIQETAVVLLGVSGNTVTSQTVVARQGDVLPGQTRAAVGFGTGLHQLAINAAGDVLYFVDLAGDLATDGAIYLNATLIAQEGNPSSISGRNYERLSSRALDLNDAGDVLFKADLDGATTDDYALVVTDSVVVRERDRPFPSPVANFGATDFGSPDAAVRIDAGANLTYASHASAFSLVLASDVLVALGPRFPNQAPYLVGSDSLREVVATSGTISASRSNGYVLYYARTGPSNVSVDGFALVSSTSTAPVSAPDVPEASAALALRAYPNPSAGAVQVRFALDREDRAAVAVYDVRGRRVSTLAEGSFVRGEHVVSWSGEDARGKRAAPGIYFVRLRTGDREQMTRVTLVE